MGRNFLKLVDCEAEHILVYFFDFKILINDKLIVYLLKSPW